MSKRKLDYNYAKDKDFAETVKNNLMDIFRSVQSNREYRESKWQEHYRAWSVDQTDADKSYEGMANLSVPQLRKEVETMSRRIYKGMFPEEYLRAETDDVAYEDLVETNTQVLRHFLDREMKIKQAALPWIKQGVLYGNSPIRTFWRKDTNEMFFRKREPEIDDSGIIRFKNKVVQEEVVTYDAPVARAEDLFNVFVYPHNASCPKDIQIHFFRTRTTKSELERKAKDGECIGLKEFKDDGNDLSWEFEEQQERLQQFGETGQFMSIQDDKHFEVLECWLKLVLPDTKIAVECVVEIINNQYITRIQRNPYWHQSHPYDWFRYIIAPPGEFYARGLPEAGISLQHQLDDTMNQTMDSATLRLNNITIINPAYAPNAESFEIEPGAQWWADPNAVKQFEFPDLTDSGYKAAGLLRQMISEMSDNQPQIPDPIAGKARSTGQAQLAVNEWQTDLFTFIDYISTEALSPMASKIHSLIQQFIPEEKIIKVAGKNSSHLLDRVVTPEDIVGNYKFSWIGALQIENQAVKTQQILKFLQIYAQMPPEAKEEFRIRWQNLGIKLIRDGFMVRDFESVIDTDRNKASTPPRIEEAILRQKGMVMVQPSDDDELHIRIHTLANNDEKDRYTKAMRQKHIDEHIKQKKAKDENKQLAARVMAEQIMMQQQAAGPKQPEGNQRQISEATDPADIERGMGV